MDPVVCSGLAKRYGRTVALDGVDLEVPRGSLFGLLGPNGAGKSTLVKILAGLVRPDAGVVRLFGAAPSDRAVRGRLGYLPEHFRFPGWLTGREVLELHGRLLGRHPATDHLLRLTGLQDAGNRRVAGYSKGMQQRLGLAQALVGDPDLVLLDEPTSALDPLGRREVREVLHHLRDAGVTVLLNSHLLTEVEQVCDQVAVIRDGRMVARGETEELLAGTRVHLRVGAPAPGSIEAFASRVEERGRLLRRDGSRLSIEVPREREVPALIEAAVASGLELFEVRSERPTLEELFVELMAGPSAPGSGETPEREARVREGAPPGSEPGPTETPRGSSVGRSAPAPPPPAAQVYQIARLSWTEGLRRRTVLLGFGLTLAFIALYALAARYTLLDVNIGVGPVDVPAGFLRDLAAFQLLSFGMFTTAFLGAMVACFSAAGMVSGDAENGLLQPLLTRPLSRFQLLLGRYAGYAGVYLAYVLLLATSLILITAHYGGYRPPSAVVAVGLLALQGPVLLALVSLLAVRFPPLTTGIGAFMLFGFSFLGGLVGEVARLVDSATAERLATAAQYLVPTDPLFRMSLDRLAPDTVGADTLLRFAPFSGEPVGPTWILYAVAYGAAVFALATALFRRRDL